MPPRRKLEKSRVSKRTVVISGHKSSVSMEEPFWTAFKEIAAIRKTPISTLVSEIANDEQTVNLSSAIRLFVLAYYRDAQTPQQKYRVTGKQRRSSPRPG